jgi:hypothetical protein
MRQRLPNRRRSTSFNCEHRGLGFTCGYSRFADGRIAEVTNHKVASAVDVNARYAAIIRLSGINRFLEQNTEPAGRLVRRKRGER